MSNDLFERVLIQLHPELAQEFGYAILDDRKKLKSLEIIKDKGVDVSLVIQLARCGNGYEAYNNHLRQYKNVGDLVNQHRKELTKEEFDLLKEVLL